MNLHPLLILPLLAGALQPAAHPARTALGVKGKSASARKTEDDPAKHVAPYVIRKGDVVAVTFTKGGLRVTVHAVAGKDARAGERLPLYRIDAKDPRKKSSKAIMASATGSAEAAVHDA